MNHTPTPYPWKPGAETISGTHTPTPWAAESYRPGTICIVPLTEAGVIARLDDRMLDSVDADHIVKCVNAHDELVAALHRLLDEYGPNISSMRVDAPRRALWLAARDALAKVQPQAEAACSAR